MVVDVAYFADVPVGSYVKLEGVVEGKPEIVNTPSQKPFRFQFVRFYVNTWFNLGDVNVRYEGAAFVRKGNKVIIWGKKDLDQLIAHKIETEDLIIKLY